MEDCYLPKRDIWRGDVLFQVKIYLLIHIKVLVGKPEERVHWGDQDVDGRIILRWIFRKWEGVVGTRWSWLRIGTDGGRGFSIKCVEFLD